MCNPRTWRADRILKQLFSEQFSKTEGSWRNLSSGKKLTGSLDATPRQEPGGQHDLKLGLGNSRINGAFVPTVGKLSVCSLSPGYTDSWSASRPATRRLSPAGRWRAACPFDRSSLQRRSVELSVSAGLVSMEAEAGNASRICPALAGAWGGSRPGWVAAERCHRACLSVTAHLTPFSGASLFMCLVLLLS